MDLSTLIKINAGYTKCDGLNWHFYEVSPYQELSSVKNAAFAAGDKLVITPTVAGVNEFYVVGIGKMTYRSAMVQFKIDVRYCQNEDIQPTQALFTYYV